MIKIVEITLENEMDLVLAYKHSLNFTQQIGLTIATQTTFATAVSEISRAIIEYTDAGVLSLGLHDCKERYHIKAELVFPLDIMLTESDEGYRYAKRLVPEFRLEQKDDFKQISMLMGLPRSIGMDRLKIERLRSSFEHASSLNAYENIKRRNITLNLLREQNEEEIKRSRLIDEQKNDFIAMASHELKTPITIIKAYTQLVKMTNTDCSEKINHLIDKIDLQTIKLSNLVQQMLDISKMEKGKLTYNMQILQLNGFVEDIISTMTHILPDHRIDLSLCDDTLVNIDPFRLEQVISNLLGNAGKYSDKQTTIVVKTIKTEDNSIIIHVTDQGIGMSKENLQSVFDKFYRIQDVTNSHPGLGMGLYIASKIVSDHGGSIWAESVLGQGSTFSFSIPQHVMIRENQ